MPPEMREMMTSGAGTALGIVVGFFFALFAGIVFILSTVRRTPASTVR